MKGEKLTLHGWFKGIRHNKDHTAVTLALPKSQLGRDVLGALAQFCTNEQEGWFMLKTADFDPEEEEAMESLEVAPEDDRKTPSQRLRAKLFVLFKKQNEGYEDFELFYRFKMSQLDAIVQAKIDKLSL